MRANQRRYSGIAIVVAGMVLQSCITQNHPTGPIEQTYYAPGTWSVTTSVLCCDSLGNNFDLYYPVNLGMNNFMHPILTWGNGTNGKPADYTSLLTHLASWGFVVIATEDKNTGPGQTILDGAKFLIAANANNASPFFNKLNVNAIGALGHSQGAGGSLNALIKSTGTIKTALPIELPSRIWCSGNCVNIALLTGSVFFVDGSFDPISPPTQNPGTTGLQSLAVYYAAVPNTVAKVTGTLIGPTHNDVTGNPACTTAQPPCLVGVYGYLGYPTAWMLYQLQGDNFAHGAFVSGTGEIFAQHLNWEHVASNIP